MTLSKTYVAWPQDTTAIGSPATRFPFTSWQDGTQSVTEDLATQGRKWIRLELWTWCMNRWWNKKSCFVFFCFIDCFLCGWCLRVKQRGRCTKVLCRKNLGSWERRIRRMSARLRWPFRFGNLVRAAVALSHWMFRNHMDSVFHWIFLGPFPATMLPWSNIPSHSCCFSSVQLAANGSDPIESISGVQVSSHGSIFQVKISGFYVNGYARSTRERTQKRTQERTEVGTVHRAGCLLWGSRGLPGFAVIRHA